MTKLIETALLLLRYDKDFNGYIMTRNLSKVIDIKVRHVINTVTFRFKKKLFKKELNLI